MKLLNENCKFQCLAGNPSILITATEQGNHIARDGRKKILTEKAKCNVKMPLPCIFLTAMANGTPTNCQLSETSWLMPNDKITCNGHKVLTEFSSMPCKYGGIIKPIGSNCIMQIGLAAPVNEISKGVERQPQRKKEILKDADGTQELGSILKDTGEKKESASLFQNAGKGQEEDVCYVSHALCDYEHCDEREECKYFKSQIYVENSSSRLSANFQKNRKSEWDAYVEKHHRKNAESPNGGWRIAAHHIISGNQVLMMKDASGRLLYGEIVKLANYFGYDVNNEWNCIMLPTNEIPFSSSKP